MIKKGDKVKLIKALDELSHYNRYVGKVGEVIGDIGKNSAGEEFVGVKFDDGACLSPFIKNLIVASIIKKSDLQGGDIVTYRNGNIRIVDIENKRTVYLNDFSNNSMPFSNYNEDLFHWDDTDSDWDIVEVYRPTTKETFITERTKGVKKMTVAEICKELGYDVEIIKGDK